MFPHVDLQVVLLHKALAAVLTEVGLGVCDSHVTVQFVRLELSSRHKTPPAHIADERLLSGVNPDVALQLGLGGEGLVAAVTGMGSNLQVDLEMMLPGRGILEGLATVRTDVDLLVGIIKVSSPDVSLQVARMVELLLAVGTVKSSNFVLRVVSLQVVSQHTAGHVALQTDRTLELQLGGVELHVVGEGLGGAEDLVASLTEMLWSCGGAVSLHMFLQICLFVEPETTLGAGKLWT